MRRLQAKSSERNNGSADLACYTSALGCSPVPSVSVRQTITTFPVDNPPVAARTATWLRSQFRGEGECQVTSRASSTQRHVIKAENNATVFRFHFISFLKNFLSFCFFNSRSVISRMGPWFCFGVVCAAHMVHFKLPPVYENNVGVA